MKRCVYGCEDHVPFECHYIRGEGAGREISQDSLDMMSQLEREVKIVI